MLFIQLVNKYQDDERNEYEKELLIEKFNGKQEIEYKEHYSYQNSKIGLWSDFCHLGEAVKFIQSCCESDEEQKEKGDTAE